MSHVLTSCQDHTWNCENVQHLCHTMSEFDTQDNIAVHQHSLLFIECSCVHTVKKHNFSKKANKHISQNVKYLHIFAQHCAFIDAPLRNKHLIKSPFLSSSHMDEYNRHIVLGHCHCDSLWALPPWYWSLWIGSLRTSYTVNCCVWGTGGRRKHSLREPLGVWITTTALPQGCGCQGPFRQRIPTKTSYRHSNEFGTEIVRCLAAAD